MKREILFRGKRRDNGEWVYGDLIHGQGGKYGNMYILPQTMYYPPGCNALDGYNVTPETVGQFTGLTDKNGKKIFEGDIVKWDDCSNGKYWRLAVVELKPDIQFNCGLISSMKGIENSTTNTFRYGNFAYQKTELYLEIVGNIFDNSELLNETIQNSPRERI